MPKKKEIIRVSTRTPRFRENTSFMRAHETMVDLIKGNASGSIMDMFGAGLLGLDFLKDLDLDPDRDLTYSDEDDNDFNQQNETHKPLEPHPQIKELVDEKADNQIKESIEEEEKRKVKTNKNKRKKMRKKEKKRLEKDNLENKLSPEEEQEKSDSSETQEENIIIDSKSKELDKSTTDLLDEPQTKPQCDESSKITNKEKLLQINTKDDEKLDCKKSSPCIPEPVPEEKPKGKPEKYEKTLEKESVEVKQPKQEKPEVDKSEYENAEDTSEIIKEEKQECIGKVTMDPIVQEYAKRSREIAAFANRLASTGQYEMAVKYFTDAIKYNPTEYKLFGNRSLCFERLQKYENALSDAEVALSMEPNWTKGLFRKGKALSGLKRYYEASLIYKEVLKLESTSKEAVMELKRAQTLHLMEMGFTWAQSTNALKSHATLEEAIEALFTGEGGPSLREIGACKLDVPEQRAPEPVYNEDEGEWIIQQSARLRPQQYRETGEQWAPRNQVKPELFPVWVGSLAPTVTYATLHEVFSRAGRVYSIKMVLEHHCAFVNYTRKEECDRAVQAINGMVVEGCPLSVRYPSRIPFGIGVSKNAMTDPLTPGLQKKECFFWRTIGCTRGDCTFKHVPEHKGIDREKYTSKVNYNNIEKMGPVS